MKGLTSNNSHSLVKLGFTPDEVRVYETLIKDGPANARALSKKVNVLPNALYRLLKKLISKGLVSPTDKHPAIYRAISPQIALDSYIKNKQTELENIKENIIDQLITQKGNDQTRIDLIRSAQEFFLTYAELAKQASKEILIISIGEHVPDEVLLANRDAIERGVRIRFIAHKCDSGNLDLLKRWQKMGLQVRHYSDWGFHLVVFDNIKSVLSINNPNNTNERVAFIIHSKGLAKAHSDYFYSVWEKAIKI